MAYKLKEPYDGPAFEATLEVAQRGYSVGEGMKFEETNKLEVDVDWVTNRVKARLDARENQ